ncbi:hypothetical protein BJX63DRAFT_436807 [Aspergillus granulosus]|uniref:Uncharacterized protein n=1 Tax=Aspergillus granulosus TaxID=176169 RepID=A0ABR4GXJ1_9EURO
MKPSIYLLAALLPFATQLVVANPVAEPDPDAFAEAVADPDNNRQNDNNCKVKQSYHYYKYPCKSSTFTGDSQVGTTFTSSCKYQDRDSGIWWQTPRGWVKDENKPKGCRSNANRC